MEDCSEGDIDCSPFVVITHGAPDVLCPILLIDMDLPVEGYFPFVHVMEDLEGKGEFENALHGKMGIAVESGPDAGGRVEEGNTDGAVGVFCYIFKAVL